MRSAVTTRALRVHLG